MNNLKNILCIMDPSSLANSQCAEIYMDYLKNQGVHVDYLVVRYDYTLPIVEKNGDSFIYRFDSYIVKYLHKCGKKFKAHSWQQVPRWFRGAAALIHRIKYIFRHKTDSVHLDSVNYKNILELFSGTNIKYDAIISISYPFALHVIANYLKRAGIAPKWFPIFLDPYVYSFYLSNNTLKLNYRKKLVEKFLANADKIFMVRGIMEENIKRGFNPDYHKKVTVIEHPTLINKKINAKPTVKKNKTTLVYAGMFYKDIRNPEKMLDVLAKLPSDMEIVIMGYGCEDIIENKKSLFSENLKFMGKLPRDKCTEVLLSSNIFINLGNTVINQIPSKVFEYISMGKPIINFYFNEQDTSLYYLKKYELAYNINLNNHTESDIAGLIDFCKNNSLKQISFEEATKNMVESRSDNACKLIYQTIKESVQNIKDN